jgi:Transcription factor WhiB
VIFTDADPAGETGPSGGGLPCAELGDTVRDFHRRGQGAVLAILVPDNRDAGERAAMTSTESVNVVVRTGRAGRYADWRITPETLRSWHRQGLCNGFDTAVFFPADDECPSERQHRERIAKAICAACPVRQPCAVYALVHRELHGVWGGLSEADRRRQLTHP